jgi:hypothetical protein
MFFNKRSFSGSKERNLSTLETEIDSIYKFFDETIPEMARSLRGRINDNFQTIKPVFLC